MDIKIIERFREQLQQRRDRLVLWMNDPNLKTTRILGKVAGKSADTKSLVTEKIDRALKQMEEGNFGGCTLCDGEVEEERLALDFTTCVCLDHYSESQKRDLEQDLELAAKVQRQLFPSEIPILQGLQLAVRSEPSKIVGGDYFDFFPMSGGRQGFVIADVMGKGLPASMLMSNLQASLRILGPENDDLGKTVTRLNQLFRFNLKTIRFITLVIGTIDVSGNTLVYCNAGHHPPFWFRNDTADFVPMNPTGPALGILSDGDFRTKRITYKAGDQFLFYTDGLVEARRNQEEFGEKRLQDLLKQHKNDPAQQILAQLFRSVKKFSTAERDDLTALLLKIEENS